MRSEETGNETPDGAGRIDERMFVCRVFRAKPLMPSVDAWPIA
jgi:hypothetical protein